MKKKLLTVAIGAALAAPAFMAQADVKVYGRVQVEFGRVSIENNGSTYGGVTAPTGVNSHTTTTAPDKYILNDTGLGRFGIAADEDLSGGWKAIGLIEMQIDTADGNTIDANTTGSTTATTGIAAQMIAAREVYVGVSHKDVGTLKFGRHNSPYLNAGVAMDPFVTTMLEGRGNLGMSGSSDGVLSGHNSFVSNGMVFNSPTWGGFGFQLYYGLDQSGTESTALGAQGANSSGDTSVNVGWAGGPAKVFASYNKQNVSVVGAATGATVQTDSPTSYQVGGALVFGGTTLKLMYEDQDTGVTNTDNTSLTAITGRTWIMAGVEQKIGNFNLVGNISQFTADGSTAAEQEGQYYAAGGIWSLSKTARVFAGYRATTNKRSSNALVLRDERVSSIGLRKDF